MISIIVAMAKNRVIGRDGDLPWHVSADLRRFKQLTMSHAIIMGRKTYDSIGRPLPGRRSIVISRKEDFAPAGVEVVGSLADALERTAADDEAFVIGGSSIYLLALPLARRLYVTEIDAEVEGDVLFPNVDFGKWQLVEEGARQMDEASGLGYRFLVYDRPA